MLHDCQNLLREVIRVAHDVTSPPLQRGRQMLTLLAEGLHAEQAVFWWPAPNHPDGGFCLSLPAAEQQPLPCPDHPSFIASLSPDHRPSLEEDRLLLPLLDRGHLRAALLLQFSHPLPAGQDPLPAATSVGWHLVHLLTDTPPAPLDSICLLADLSQIVERNGTLDSLLATAARTILGATGALGIALRPLHGETVLAQPSVAWQTRSRRQRQVFLELEQQLTRQAIATGRQQTGQLQTVKGNQAMQLSCTAWPIQSRKRLLGTMTVLTGVHATPTLPVSCPVSWPSLAAQLGQSLALEAGRQDLALLITENRRKLEEARLLCGISQAMHGTPKLDELMHLVLSAATLPWSGGFERAMLFLANERSGILQGMVGVTRDTACRILPDLTDDRAWQQLRFSEDICQSQRQTPFFRLVLKQRLPLEADDNPLARALLQERILFLNEVRQMSGSFGELARNVELGNCALVPLHGHTRPLGVMVLDNPGASHAVSSDLRRFLELFAAQSAQAMENSMLLHRLEVSHQDLRETQEALIQKEKMAALGETAASVTHELRNPLVSIGGFARRLAERLPPNSREQEYSAIIVREVLRMEAQLSSILAFSKKQLLCFAPCTVPGIIDEALALEEPALAAAGIRLERFIDDQLPAIQGDEQQLRQVMINLISNARQSMAGGGCLTLRCRTTSLRGEVAVAIEVEDTGGGIPANILRNIFNPFFTTRQSGTGLGLSIVHRIVEHHRGEIEVRNLIHGALFIIRLPIAPPPYLSIDKPGSFG
jgi:signal transduction histidine kinase